MKNTLLFLLATVCYSSCYKAQIVPVSTAKPTFSIFATGGNYYSSYGSITDSVVTFTANDSTSLSISLRFTVTSGNPKDYQITTYISGLPPGITITTDSVSFKLNFTATFNFSVKTDTGYYALNINVVTPDGTNIYPIRIHVIPVTDYAPGLAATYYGNDPCGLFSLGNVWYTYTSTVATAPGSPHWIAIRNFRGIGDSSYVYAFVSGSGNLDISVPLQTVNGYTIYGTGFTMADTGPGGGERPAIDVRDTIVHAGDTQTCITQLRQRPW